MYANIRTAFIVATLLSALALFTQPAHAQAGTDEVARGMVTKAISAAESGNWVAARENFKKAYALQPLVLTLYNLAAAQEKTEQYVEADQSYRIFLRDAADEGQTKAFRELAIKARARLKNQIAFLVVEIENLHKDDVLRIGGQAIAHAILGEPKPSNPGEVDISIEREGTLLESEKVMLAPGTTERVELVLIQRPETLVKATPNPDPQKTILGGATTKENDLKTQISEEFDRGPLLWTAVGVGAVVVVGATLGAVALFTPGPSYNSDLDTVDLEAR